MELRERARCRTSTSCWRPPRLCSARLRASTGRGASSRPSRRSSTAGRSFMAGGAPGHGEAAPGDHLQTGYRLWLVGHQLEHGRAAVARPVHLPARGGPQPNAGLAVRARRTGRSSRVLGPVLAWNVFTLLCLFGAGVLALLWLRELGLSPLAAARRRARVRDRARTASMQSRGHLLGPISMLLPLALWAFERARRTGDQRWWWLSRRGARLDPALGPGAPRARGDPVLRRCTRSAARARAGRLSRRAVGARRGGRSPAC